MIDRLHFVGLVLASVAVMVCMVVVVLVAVLHIA